MRLGPEKSESTGMRLSQEKVNKLAAVTTDALAAMKKVEFNEPYEDVRAAVRRIIEELLREEQKIDQAARQKIESQRRVILEGTPEWDILYRKYYNEEVRKLGI
jgi:uncharacterized protein